MEHIQWFLMICATAFCGLILAAAITKFVQARAARAWPAATGTVVTSRVKSHKKQPGDIGYNSSPSGNVTNTAFVEFEYEVKGRRHRCDRISILEQGINAEIAKTLERYPVGAAVTVYYNPADPGKAVLERDFPAKLAWGVGLLLLIFGGVPVALLFAFTDIARRLTPYVAHADRTPLIVLLGAMGVFATLIALGIRRQVSQSRHWQITPGHIALADVEQFEQMSTHDVAPTRLFKSSIIYTYEVDGCRYAGDRLSFGARIASTNKRLFNRTLAKYGEDDEVAVYYNPENPAESVLERRAPFMFVLWLAAFGLFGAAVAIAAGKITP